MVLLAVITITYKMRCSGATCCILQECIWRGFSAPPWSRCDWLSRAILLFHHNIKFSVFCNVCWEMLGINCWKILLMCMLISCCIWISFCIPQKKIAWSCLWYFCLDIKYQAYIIAEKKVQIINQEYLIGKKNAAVHIWLVRNMI